MKKEQLRPHIIGMMIDEGIEKLETGLGKFSILKTKKWEYPEEVVELGDRFNVAKTKAQQTGEATFEETESLRFTSAKL